MSFGNFIKSISDKRIYKPINLKNNIQCLLISDKDAQKSAAALSVGIGSFKDPLQAQGLAHYLEHMLFMGTKKYPDQNEYSSFLSKNAGSSNAYTSLQQTNYYFEVSHNAFFDALDRFSRFFIDPLMMQQSSQRQLNAVHSQHSKNLQNDSWRKYQLTKHLSKANHPYHKFSTGDKTTLSNPNLREMLLNFYDNNYSSNIMKLVVYGQADIDTLKNQVQAKFNDVSNKNYSRLKIQEHPYDDQVFGKILKVVPVKDKKVLQMVWVLNDQSSFYKSPPSRYVSHLVGHEGKGSLLSFLISQGLATGLSAYGSDNWQCYSQFNISITLTDKGLGKIQQIMSYVYFYIEMLKKRGPQKWVVDQIKKVNHMKFDFMQKRQGMSFCSGLAKNMHTRKIQQLLIYPYFMQQFEQQKISNYLNQITQKNMIAILQAKQLQKQCTQQQPIYKSKYSIDNLQQITPLECKVSLPQVNKFIPNNLSIFPVGNQLHPQKVYESKYIQAFFKQDHQFQLPKAQLNFRFYFDAQNTVRQQVARSLFQKMLKQNLRQFTYAADMAELDSQISFSSFYILNIKIAGFRDSLQNFISQYLKLIFEYTPNDQQLFNTLKQKQKRQYANYFLDNPYQIGYNRIVDALRDGASNSPNSKLSQIDTITLQDIVTYSRNWKKKVFMQFYLSGNQNKQNALKYVKLIQDYVSSQSLSLNKNQISCIRAVFLPQNKVCAVEEILQSKSQTNNSLIVHYQYQAFTLKNKILQQLAHSFIKQPAFNYLRTQHQLGYIVMALSDDHRGILGHSILVQSNIKNSYQLQQYVDKFVNDILKKKIESLSQAQLQQYKKALQNTKKQKDKTLGSQASRFWGQIVKHSFQFQRKQKQVESIPKITLQQFKQFIHNIFYKNPRIFQMHEIAQSSKQKSNQLRNQRLKKQQNFKVYDNIQTFRKKMPLYPDYYSHL